MRRGRELELRFAGFVGWEVWKNWLPRGMQARSVAKKALRLFNVVNLEETPLFVVMIDGSYRVLDHKGRVEKVKRAISKLG